MRSTLLSFNRMPLSRLAHRSQGFRPSDLERLRRVLDPIPTFPINMTPPHTLTNPKGRTPAESAVLVPLMNINDESGVLFQVRSARMRVHAGEVGFPGGKADPEDSDLVHTALREAYEELQIEPSKVDILGALPPEYSLGNRARVWPIVAFLHDQPRLSPDSSFAFNHDEVLPSPGISDFVPSPDEVDGILPITLAKAVEKQRHQLHFFRLAMNRPYVKIRAEDLVIPRSTSPLEIWGLSGWFFNQLAWRAGWLEQPVVSQPETWL